MLISLSGVLMPGPLVAVTVEKAAKSKAAGLLISLGHGVVEFPLMFIIYFWLSNFAIPKILTIAIGLIGGLAMMLMGFQTFRNRKMTQDKHFHSNKATLAIGIWTTAANAGFILWWLTIGTALILNAQQFGLVGFSVFAVVHWLCDFAVYTAIAFAIFKSRRFWNEKVNSAIFLFCFAVFIGFGAWFFSSALWSLVTTFS
jgi:threonine/homoserine/homoserine lactone efflux protein